LPARSIKKISEVIFYPFFEQYSKELKKEIVGSCETLLDVGCGANSPIRTFSKDLRYTVGVDAHGLSLKSSRTAGIHSEYQLMDVLRIGERFEKKSFDCVLLSDLIEHLSKADALKLITSSEAIAKKKIIIFTPNGFLPQDEYDGNLHQVHLSGWTVREMRGLGYAVSGLNGWKPLRTKNARIAWKPEFLWGKISLLTQPLVIFHPEKAFHLFCVKDVSQNKAKNDG